MARRAIILPEDDAPPRQPKTPPIGPASPLVQERGPATTDDELLETLAEFEFDPYGFVLWAFPWGEPGTELEHETGPDEWQRELLQYVGARLREGGDVGSLVQVAARSGHGVGKSAATAWLILWAISTFENTRGVVTAMTEPQLRQKTWAELARWHGLFIGRSLFELTATSIKPAHNEESKEWRIDAVPWSAQQPAAFAGLHNKGRRILLLMDEGSEISDVIYEVSEGAMTDTDTQIIWAVFGNPTTSTGRFFDLFGDKGRRRWRTWTIDSRNSKFSNKLLIKSWADEYGDDSDFFRVRVKGLPPRAGVSNFIAPEDVRKARDRVLRYNDYASYPIVMAVDPAEFGDNNSVVTVRQGPKVHKRYRYSGIDGIDLAGRVADIRMKEWPTCGWVGVESTGIGASCVAALRRVPGFPLYPINPALPAADDQTYCNIRAEAWGRMREALEFAQWLDDDDLQEQACSVNYGYDGRMRYQLESKKDMRRRGVSSPDDADSLALTYVADTITVKPGVKARAQPQKRRIVIM